MPNPVVLIMAGGTGGHVFPALAVANELRQQGLSVHWLGTAQGIEADIVPNADIQLHCLTIKGLRGKGLLGLFAAPFKITLAILQALKIIHRLKPQAVVGFGGYVAGPGGVAAKLAAVPLIIHEQNAIAGMTNKLLNRISSRSLQAFPGALEQAQTVGNPVRTEIANLEPPAQRYQPDNEALNILVIGGSLGAVALNNLVLAAMALIPEQQRPNLRHQVGKNNIAQMQQAYADAGVQAEVMHFIDDIAAAYAWADLVICRAGALTVAEIAAAGCAAWFIPFPFAVDDHQSANARFLVERQAALMTPQADLTAELIADKIAYFRTHKMQLLELAQAAHQCAINNATTTVANEVKRFCHG